MRLYTIGHSSLSIEEFIDTLRQNGVEWVADVRSVPHSGRFPQFNRNAIASVLGEHGIRYLFVGDKLGGKPPAHLADQWKQGKLNPSLVSELSETEKWKDGISLLARAITSMDAEGSSGVLLCSEGDPNNCHRSKVAFDLEHAMYNLEIVHLRPSGQVAEASFQKTLLMVREDEGTYH
jgi:uncharacterized protein (DUF488 family)